jgi:hypothetical protein
VNTILRWYGSWKEFHLQMEGEFPRRRGFPRSDEELISILCRCAEEVESRPSISRYDRWRKARRVSGADPLPKVATLTRRLGDGSWPAAVARALDYEPPPTGAQ